MNIVFPMAGHGIRFQKAGFNKPKFLIEINGKSLLEYSIESIPKIEGSNLIFIALDQHIKLYNIKSTVEKILEREFNLVGLEKVTRGQAETVLKAKKFMENDMDLIIYNIDTYFKSNSLLNSLKDKNKKHDGILGAFKGKGSNWSYAKIDENGFIVRTSEKIPISDWALTGFYHFSNTQDFIRIAEKRIGENITDASEYYIAPMYNDLIMEGKKFVLDICDKFVPLGTPEDLRIAEQSAL